MMRALPCSMPGQNCLISEVHERFMGYLKSMSSAIRTSASNRVARHSYVSSSRASCRHLITRALPCAATCRLDAKAILPSWKRAVTMTTSRIQSCNKGK